MSHIKKQRKISTFEGGTERVKYKLCKRLTYIFRTSEAQGNMKKKVKSVYLLLTDLHALLRALSSTGG
jgi:hypothetical protein